ncbi:hypothetical protein PFICI_03335 [Pestalotiopsis fici W106-1]|uniref:FAD-binding domain-containing protein n=1 Tax=Pestalotiopsis fici (strain W106-1 / CGMCC3.15140) TaxID=1229662 RepID=W3XH06_PESFW|nr:uncharacterized protein PFICI_03335 [Pestalotiopsis fici W106-1]ETS85310.1 hypothetical protein PFICI_03335 [Pestalotiopsis fici W106-1]
MAPLKVIIVGGGLAGACLANGLINKATDPIEVLLFERDHEASDRDGYQIRLGAHALTGFRACLTERQYSDLLLCFGRSGGVVSSAPAIYSPEMDLLLDLGKFPAYTKSAPIGRARLRNFLQSPLREKSKIRYGKKFVRFEVLGSGDDSKESRIRVHFEDGSGEDCDILVSAEGSGSRANKQLGCNNISATSSLGAGSMLGKCHLPWTVLRALPRPLLDKGTMFAATAKATLFAAAYLPDSLSPSAQNASAATDLKGIKKPSNYDEEQASLMVGVAWTEGLSSMEAAQLPDAKAFLRDKLMEAGFHAEYLKLIDALDPDAIQGVPFRTSSDTAVDWRRRLLEGEKASHRPEIGNPRVWLIGDAIHPMLPSRGMGANQALHDTADALGPLLALAKRKSLTGTVSDEEVRLQLETYENAMIPRAFTWVKRSAAQNLPGLDTFKGRAIIFVLRVGLVVVGAFMEVRKLFGWKPTDDAPELR